jgi:hypothetical protein
MQLIVRSNQTHLLEIASGECVKDVKVLIINIYHCLLALLHQLLM